MPLTSWLRRQKRWMIIVAIGTTCQLGCASSNQLTDYFRSAIALLAADLSTQFATSTVRTIFPETTTTTS